METILRPYKEEDIPSMITIWNSIIKEGTAFPQEEPLTIETAKQFFASQSYCAVATQDAVIQGLYILHPNNIGRCSHIANASFAVDSSSRGKRIGEKLVKDCLKIGHFLGFRILQFNAVVSNNLAATNLYKKLGFIQLGTVPQGFRNIDNTYVDICLFYKTL
jgi:L-amino acid N-acyltransferase YncA